MLAAALTTALALWTAAPVPSAPSRWVEDDVGLLSPAVRDRLDQRLEGYQRATGHQIVVWIGGTIGDADLADWAVRTFAAWKIGRAGIDDGIVVFVLADDRMIDIEVGYGLEDRVPDAIAARIIGEVMTPRLRAGDPDGAITAGIDATLAAIEGKPWVGQDTPPAPSSGPTTLELLVGALLLIAALIFLVKHPRLALFMLASALRRGGGGDHRRGFSGGGGRSGGGGARGRW